MAEVKLIANANDNLSTARESVVRLSDGKLFASRPLATNPFYYSTDNGDTWTNLTHTPTDWITASGSASSIFIDEFDNIYVSYISDTATNRHRLGAYEFSGSAPTSVTNITTANFGIGSMPSYGLAFAHPDASGDILVVLAIKESTNTRWSYQNVIYDGATLTLGTSGVILTDATANSSRFSWTLHNDASSAIVPASATTPVISAFLFDGQSAGAGVLYRVALTWNGTTNWTVGTVRNSGVANNHGFNRGCAWTGSEVVLVACDGAGTGTIDGWRCADGSAVTLTNDDPPTTSRPTTVNMIYVASSGTEIYLYMADTGVAGIVTSTYTGTWSAYTTLLSGAGEIDNFAGVDGVSPSAGVHNIVVKDEAGATDQIYYVLLLEATPEGEAAVAVNVAVSATGRGYMTGEAVVSVAVTPSATGRGYGVGQASVGVSGAVSATGRAYMTGEGALAVAVQVSATGRRYHSGQAAILVEILHALSGRRFVPPTPFTFRSTLRFGPRYGRRRGN